MGRRQDGVGERLAARARTRSTSPRTLERGIDSLRAHHAYLAYVGTDPDPFLREAAEGMGKQLGVAYATTFEVFPF